MSNPTDFDMKDPPALNTGATADTNAALGKAIERMQQPCSGATDEARERAWLEQCRSLDTRHITALTEEVFGAGYDAARAEHERKVAELEMRLAEMPDADQQARLRAEARVRELSDGKRYWADRAQELGAALATERERGAIQTRFISAVRSDVEEYKSEPFVDWNPREYMKRIHAHLVEYTKRALSATPPADVPDRPVNQDCVSLGCPGVHEEPEPDTAPAVEGRPCQNVPAAGCDPLIQVCEERDHLRAALKKAHAVLWDALQ